MAQPTSAYDFYYWPLPFRGQFIRALLACAGQTWQEHDQAAIERLHAQAPADQPVPLMGPPMLIDKRSGFALSQMTAIALYLGERHGLLPASPELRALTTKVVADANDVIDELTLDGGREMWTPEKWQAFVPRLQHWMTMWEVMAARHGVRADAGYLLGTPEPGVADIVTSTLWTTMADRFGQIGELLERTAPVTAALSRRLQQVPALKALSARAWVDYGDAYCGGQIEASMRRVIGAAPVRCEMTGRRRSRALARCRRARSGSGSRPRPARGR